MSKTARFTLRATEEEKSRVSSRAAQIGLTMSDYLKLCEKIAWNGTLKKNVESNGNG